uniref:Uracil phosphoribosyltransferase n=1 Tax=Alsidium seaforthii TaxID=2007182 RepID=A0A1Z1ME57_9FLOR|nr:uracil phosphoribosyltransferase [Bryothamnion seaforthii]ARW64044.1 uracil phosphoribosyltransferase [Bryothamnion seaforthii]
MQLNIYKVSHPIIQILSNLINNENNKVQNTEFYHRYTGLLLIYETLRKYIKINVVYIKCINSVENISAIDYRQKYYILTSLSNTYQMVSDIKSILPHIEIIDISKGDIIDIEKTNNQLKTKNHSINCFILEKRLNNFQIINLIEYLEKDKGIPPDNIQIICLSSQNDILNKLGYHYPMLKVYTTQINR